MFEPVLAASAATKYAVRQECSTSHLLEGANEQLTRDGSTMNPARRPRRTRASSVASAETIFSHRGATASSSDRCLVAQSTARPADTIANAAPPIQAWVSALPAV